MIKASKLFNDEQKERINQAVQQAELKTSVEIVPALATASGRYDRPEDIVGLWVGVIAMLVTWFFLPTPQAADSWGGWPSWANPLLMIVAMVVGFIVGVVIAMNVGWLRKLFTPRKEMTDEVAARAVEVFATSGVYRTRDATGLLIYVSLFERKAVIEADKTVLEKIGQPVLDELCAGLIAKLRAGDPTAAFCDTIAAAAEKLAPVLPRPEDDTDELPNELMIFD